MEALYVIRRIITAKKALPAETVKYGCSLGSANTLIPTCAGRMLLLRNVYQMEKEQIEGVVQKSAIL